MGGGAPFFFNSDTSLLVEAIRLEELRQGAGTETAKRRSNIGEDKTDSADN